MLNHLYIAVLIFLAGICAYSAIQHFTNEHRWPQRRVHLLFATTALLMSLQALFHALVLQASAMADYLTAQRATLAIIVLIFFMIPWLLAEYTGVRPMPILAGFSSLFALLFFINLTQPFTLQHKEIHGLWCLTLPWGERVAVPQATPSAWAYVTAVAILLVLAFAFYQLSICFRRDRRRMALVMMSAVGLVSVIAVHGILVRLQIFHFVPLGPFGYLGMVIIMGATLNYEMREDRNRAEKALRESEEKYRLLVENAKEAIYVLQEGIYKYANRICGEALGVPATNLIGSSVLGFIHPDDRKKSIAQHLRFLNGELTEARTDFRVLTRHGEERWVDVSSVGIRWEGKTATLNFATDITERKQAEEEKAELQNQLLQSQKMEAVGRLAGGVAHDFNNMLGVILGHAEIAIRQVDPAQPLHANLQEVRKAAERSSDLTRQLLGFARRQTVTPKVLDLNKTIEGMLKMLWRLIGEDIHLNWLPDTALWPIKVDPSQIDQILVNLCVNARDAIMGVGKVTIETGNISLGKDYCANHVGFVPGDYALLAVSDDGCGMAKETLRYVFEPFFTTKEKGKGTGLGLATVYGIVKQNNGFIYIHSEPAQGTTFKIYLPRHIGKAEQVLKKKTQEPVMGGQETVLVVEDEPSLLDVSKLMLETQGYLVLTAGTPGEAVRLAEEYTGEIHLLLTDVVMPEMNGRDLAKKMLSFYPNLKRLFMSGYTADIIAHNGVLDEGVHFIQKPFSRKDLLAKVRETLDHKLG